MAEKQTKLERLVELCEACDDVVHVDGMTIASDNGNYLCGIVNTENGTKYHGFVRIPYLTSDVDGLEFITEHFDDELIVKMFYDALVIRKQAKARAAVTGSEKLSADDAMNYYINLLTTDPHEIPESVKAGTNKLEWARKHFEANQPEHDVDAPRFFS